jgi:hypothetical protein
VIGGGVGAGLGVGVGVGFGVGVGVGVGVGDGVGVGVFVTVGVGVEVGRRFDVRGCGEINAKMIENGAMIRPRYVSTCFTTSFISGKFLSINPIEGFCISPDISHK